MCSDEVLRELISYIDSSIAFLFDLIRKGSGEKDRLISEYGLSTSQVFRNSMALSVEKLLADAQTLVIHLKDHDNLADSIIATTQSLYNKVEAMKQYQDDITELNEIAKHRPRSTLVLGIAQENRQIRELQQENRELQAALEEHQSALELIMQKYREHTVKLLQSNRIEKAIQERDGMDKDSMCQLMDKIDEMASVMQKAIEVDETVGCADKERLSRLEVENRALREMLEICTTSKEKIIPIETPKEVKKEDVDDDDTTDTECDSTILIQSEKKEVEEDKDSEDKKKKQAPEADSKESTSSPSKESAPTATKESTSASSKEGASASSKESTAGSKESTPSSSKDTTPTSSKESTPTNTPKAVGTSKSAGDVRKGRVTPGKTDGTTTVKKTVSSTGVKKESTTLKKSPSTEAKKDLKSKVATKTIGKK